MSYKIALDGLCDVDDSRPSFTRKSETPASKNSSPLLNERFESERRMCGVLDVANDIRTRLKGQTNMGEPTPEKLSATVTFRESDENFQALEKIAERFNVPSQNVQALARELFRIGLRAGSQMATLKVVGGRGRRRS